MEIDLENSDLAKGIVRFKQSTITYKDVEDTLKLGKNFKSIIINESNASKLVNLSRLMNINILLYIRAISIKQIIIGRLFLITSILKIKKMLKQ